MAIEEGKNGRLNSWKEISVYLDVDVRTCRRYELRLNLPIHRIQDSPKSRVYAYKDELDAWLTKKANNNNFNSDSRLSPFIKKMLWLVAALVSVALIIIFTGILKQPLPPYDFKTEGSRLIILDEEGKELWQYDTGRERLRGEEHYREFYQISKLSEKRQGRRNFPNLMFKDLDGNGSVEVLFSIHTYDYMDEGYLLCFNERGKLLWERHTGRELTYADGTTYTSDSRIYGFDTWDLDGDGRLEIVCVAHQWMQFPSHVMLFDLAGELKGDYWNSGRIVDFCPTDLDGDGNLELVCGGLNNEGGVGCLFVLDPWNMHGTSPQTEPKFITNDLEKGTQLHYVRLPRTSIDREHSLMNGVKTFSIMQNGNINLYTIYTNIIYEFDPKLESVDVRFSHTYMTLHNRAYSEGLIDVDLDDESANEEYKQMLVDQIQYYDGNIWKSIK